MNEADIMVEIVRRFTPTKIYNLSVSRKRPESYIHMPIWAATIDKLMWENDIIFIVSAGNLPKSSDNLEIPGITSFLSSGINYPDYLKDIKSKITNPAYSCFAITVGSICQGEFDNLYLSSFGKINFPSSFSRSGLGLWGMIKPDIVEYGGDFIYEKANNQVITTRSETSPNLIRSTRDGGPAISRDMVGTSFSTPKVSHIAAEIQKLYPEESGLLYRGLIVQSARIPEEAKNIDGFIEHYGYGLPNLSRATENSMNRVTLYSSGNVNPKNADLYLVKIPREISRPGNEYNILIEITLSYKAEPRITRRGTKSYLSAWLDWESSKKNESITDFQERILANSEREDNEDGEENEDIVDTTEIQESNEPGESFQWTIASRSNSGEHKGIKRQDSTVQKDWCVVISNSMPNDFIIAVKGHKGWEKDLDKTIPYSIIVSFEVLDDEVNIYNLIKIENEIEIELRTS